MKKSLPVSLGLLLVACTSSIALAHCEVPCGVYGDQRRYEAMLEDQATIAKAITQIEELSSKTDAVSKNQLVRWINTKESHASSIQTTIAQYFMHQRIKATNDNYIKSLTSAHAVMVAAMKCKQGVSAESAATLRKAILDFYKAQEGKEPHLHD